MSVPLNALTRRTLLACTLVSKPFHHGARLALLADVKMTSWTALRRISSLCSIIDSEPYLSKYIRRLHIVLDEEDAYINRLGTLFAMLEQEGVDLRQLTLECCYCRRTPLIPVTFALIDRSLRASLLRLGECSSLTTLHLKALDISVVSLTRFRHLKTLIIDGCTFRPRLLEDHNSEQNIFDTLDSLQIIHCLDALIELLLSESNGRSLLENCFSRLKTLHCVFTETSDIRNLWSLLTVFGAGNSLENLELTEVATLHLFVPSSVERFDMSRLKALRTFRLNSRIAEFRGRLNGSTAHFLLMPPLLCGPSTLEVVDIVIEDAPVHWMSPGPVRDGWTSLDEHLSDASRYPLLRNARLTVHVISDTILTWEQQDPFAVKRQMWSGVHFKTLKTSTNVVQESDTFLADFLGQW